MTNDAQEEEEITLQRGFLTAQSTATLHNHVATGQGVLAHFLMLTKEPYYYMVT